MSPRRRDVVFYAPWAGPTMTPGRQPSGGAEVQVLHLARGLAERGLRTAVVTYGVDGLPPRLGPVEVVAQRRPRRGRPLARRAALLAGTLRQLLALDTHAVVQRAAGSTTGLVAIAARLTRTRFVYSSASTIDFALEHGRLGRAAEALFSLGVRLADEVVVQTDEQADLCQARFGRRPVVIRSVAAPAPQPEAPTDGLLWIGRLAEVKNPLAFTALAAAVPEAAFTMVCVPGPEDPDGVAATLSERAAALPNLELLGPQSRDAMLDRIARATAIVSTSFYEGMPNALLEGWSRGVPALTLHHDPDGVIERERLGHCARGDSTVLADRARALWAGRTADAELRRRCRTYARREHDPDVVLGRWRTVLDPHAGAQARAASVR